MQRIPMDFPVEIQQEIMNSLLVLKDDNLQNIMNLRLVSRDLKEIIDAIISRPDVFLQLLNSHVLTERQKDKLIGYYRTTVGYKNLLKNSKDLLLDFQDTAKRKKLNADNFKVILIMYLLQSEQGMKDQYSINLYSDTEIPLYLLSHLSSQHIHFIFNDYLKSIPYENLVVRYNSNANTLSDHELVCCCMTMTSDKIRSNIDLIRQAIERLQKKYSRDEKITDVLHNCLIQLRLVNASDDITKGNLLRSCKPGYINLQGMNFTNLNLAGINLSCANLTATQFKNSSLEKANLSGAILTKLYIDDSTNIKDTKFTNCDLTKINFTDQALINLGDSDLAGSSLLYQRGTGEKQIELAIKSGKINTLEAILSSLKKTKRDHIRLDILIVAAMCGQIKIAKLLLTKYHQDVNYICFFPTHPPYAYKEGNHSFPITPLTVAAQQGHYKMVILLLKNGAKDKTIKTIKLDPWNSEKEKEFTASQLAANAGHNTIAKLLALAKMIDDAKDLNSFRYRAMQKAYQTALNMKDERRCGEMVQAFFMLDTLAINLTDIKKSYHTKDPIRQAALKKLDGYIDECYQGYIDDTPYPVRTLKNRARELSEKTRLDHQQKGASYKLFGKKSTLEQKLDAIVPPRSDKESKFRS